MGLEGREGFLYINEEVIELCGSIKTKFYNLCCSLTHIISLILSVQLCDEHGILISIL